MPVEIRNFHSAVRAEISSLISSLEEYLSSKKKGKRPPLEMELDSVDSGSSETASTDSSSEVAMIREDYLSFIAVLLSHSDSEDALIFPVLFSRTPNTRARLEAFDSEHNKINSCLNEIKTQWSIFPVVHSERARICILEDILAQSIPFRCMLLEHLDTEEQLVHPLMMDHMTTEEVNVIVGRVLGHRSSEVMAKILKLMYRHLSTEDFNVCMDNIQKSVSGTFFQKWLSALPQTTPPTDADAESTSMFEAGSVASEEEISLQNHSTVAGVMSGAIPGGLREHALDHLRKDYADPVHYSLEEVIQQENDRLTSKNNKRKRRVALSELRISKRKAATSASAERAPAPITLSEEDLMKSYFDEEEGVLGCSHYRKKCKIVAPCCSKVFVCRLCHNDSTSDGHAVDRYDIKAIVCMSCGTQQPVSNTCINEECRIVFAKYFCKICNFYNDSDDPVYHCPYCNVCRKGTGLGLDSEFFHCMTCNACVRNAPDVVHKCLSHSIERTCPICQSYLFDSVDKLKGLSCGHVMHLSCFAEYRKKAHTCPLCRTVLEEDSVAKKRE